MNHTPTPWEVRHLHVTAMDCGDIHKDGYNDHCIVDRADGRTEEEAAANAEFIERACNAHDALVEALEAIHCFARQCMGDLVGTVSACGVTATPNHDALDMSELDRLAVAAITLAKGE